MRYTVMHACITGDCETVCACEYEEDAEAIMEFLQERLELQRYEDGIDEHLGDGSDIEFYMMGDDDNWQRVEE